MHSILCTCCAGRESIKVNALFHTFDSLHFLCNERIDHTQCSLSHYTVVFLRARKQTYTWMYCLRVQKIKDFHCGAFACRKSEIEIECTQTCERFCFVRDSNQGGAAACVLQMHLTGLIISQQRKVCTCVEAYGASTHRHRRLAHWHVACAEGRTDYIEREARAGRDTHGAAARWRECYILLMNFLLETTREVIRSVDRYLVRCICPLWHQRQSSDTRKHTRARTFMHVSLRRLCYRIFPFRHACICLCFWKSAFSVLAECYVA